MYKFFRWLLNNQQYILNCLSSIKNLFRQFSKLFNIISINQCCFCINVQTVHARQWLHNFFVWKGTLKKFCFKMTHLKLKLIVNDTFAHVSYDKMASCLSKKYLDNFTRIAMTNSNVSFVSDKFCPKKKTICTILFVWTADAYGNAVQHVLMF